MTEGEKRHLWAFNQPFALAFPELEDALVAWELWSQGLGDAATSHGRFTMGVTEGYFQGIIWCRHPTCQGGGFEIEQIVDAMVQQRQETREGVLVCPGWIGDANRLPCVNSITYTVRLKYKARTPPKKPRG